jgi:hypothetical protein
VSQKDSAIQKVKKVHWAFRLTAFVASVVTLSWFFAGWRQIQETGLFADWLLLVSGTVFTVLLLGVQAYWIYFEEKDKGTLKKRIELFEKMHLRMSQTAGGTR